MKDFLLALAPGLLKSLNRWLSRQPATRVEAIGNGIGRLVSKLRGRRWNRAVENIQLAYPEKSRAECEELANRTIEHFCRSAADFLAGANRGLSEILETTELVGMEHLDRALAEGRGVLLITGHFGQWERLASYLSLSGYRLSVVARDADQEGVNGVINSFRTGPGTSVIPRGQATRPILERLKDNQIVGILPDQNHDAVYVPFFGKKAGTVLGPGVIHERTKSPVIPATCVWVAPGRYRIEAFPPLEPVELEEGAKGEAMMWAINQWLEREIRKRPEQWLWFHDRWRLARKRGLL